VLDSNGDESHSNSGESSYCRCASNYTGSHCEDYCPIQCLNAGACTYEPAEHASDFQLGDYVCRCRSGWKGMECDIAVRQCQDGLECLNGAECHVENNNTYSCKCPYTHDGFQCEHAVDLPVVTCPDGHECVNGGTCITSPTAGNRYLCQCPDSYIGDFCETKAFQSEANVDDAAGRGSVIGMGIIGVIFGVVLFVLLGVAVVFVLVTKRHATTTTVTSNTSSSSVGKGCGVVTGVLEADGSTTMPKDVVPTEGYSTEIDSSVRDEAEKAGVIEII
jgi:hypothetical protein